MFDKVKELVIRAHWPDTEITEGSLHDQMVNTCVREILKLFPSISKKL